MTTRKGRTWKGFVIVEPRSVGLGRIKAIPFFRYESHAKQTAARWVNEKLTVQRATLTLSPTRRDTRRKK